jgi:predicted DNA-binding transcriptional regulator YafY
MSTDHVNHETQPLQVWLPPLILKLLVLVVFAFVLFEATIGLGDRELGANRAWVIVAGMVGLLLLLAVDRLSGIKVSPGGVEATLTEAKVRALKQAAELEDPELAEALGAQVLRSENRDQVKAAVDLVTELNVSRAVERIKEAVRQKRKCTIRYREDPQGPVETYYAAPLDIKPGKTPATRTNDYVWVHSYRHGRVISLRLGRVMGVELSDETFDPAELMADWEDQDPDWNVTRPW